MKRTGKRPQRKKTFNSLDRGEQFADLRRRLARASALLRSLGCARRGGPMTQDLGHAGGQTGSWPTCLPKEQRNIKPDSHHLVNVDDKEGEHSSLPLSRLCHDRHH